MMLMRFFPSKIKAYPAPAAGWFQVKGHLVEFKTKFHAGQHLVWSLAKK